MTQLQSRPHYRRLLREQGSDRNPPRPVSRLIWKTNNGDRLWKPPRTKEELRQTVEFVFGTKFAPHAVCSDHSAPLDALWDAYTAADSMTVWEASRGFGGKSTGMSVLASLCLLDGANINLLGGSSHQSQRVHAAISEYWDRQIVLPEQAVAVPTPLRHLVNRPTTYYTKTILGTMMSALTASTSAARGPHPQRLLMDEVDEMKLVLFDAALGQTMDTVDVVGLDTLPVEAVMSGLTGARLRALGEARNYPTGTLLSSTHQYVDGTMTEVKKRAKEKGWTVHRWCFLESHEENGGWLTQSLIDRKRREIPDYMWEAEYVLGEPNPANRLFRAENLIDCFLHQLGTVEDVPSHLYIWDHPRQGAQYMVGADWARDEDWTSIVVLRTDVTPVRLVAYIRMQRLPWPVMIGEFDKLVERYNPKYAVYDATGVGSVVTDYTNIPKRKLLPFVFSAGHDRNKLYSDYIAAIENTKILMPHVRTIHDEHRFVRPGDFWGGISDGHVPDTISSLALAWGGYTGWAKQHVEKRSDGPKPESRMVRLARL